MPHDLKSEAAIINRQQKNKRSSDLNIDRLKAVSETMAKIIEELEEFRQEWEKNPSTLSYRVTPEQFNTIAADLLRLADENEKLREHEWIVKDGFGYCLECKWARDMGHRSNCSWNEFPASPEKPDDEK